MPVTEHLETLFQVPVHSASDSGRGFMLGRKCRSSPSRRLGLLQPRRPHGRHCSSGIWTLGNSVPAVVFKNLENRRKLLYFYSHFILLQIVCRKGTDCPQHPDHKDETTSAQNRRSRNAICKIGYHKPSPKQLTNYDFMPKCCHVGKSHI